MTTLLSTSLPRKRGAWLDRFLTWIVLALLASSAWATGGGGGGGGGTGPGGGNSGSSTDPQANASSPGEEVTSLPVVDATSGVTLLGSPRQMRGVVTEVNGVGTIVVRRLAPGRVAVTFVGDYRIVLDRSALVASDLTVVFRGGATYQGGFAILQVGGSTLQFPSERVPLPIGRLASSPRAMGALLTLDVFGPRSARTHVVADFGRSDVTLFQRSTP